MTVAGTPKRVTQLKLSKGYSERGLTGVIPEQLGSLAKLQELLVLTGNQLMGAIPAEARAS